jgi:hypothetical protein
MSEYQYYEFQAIDRPLSAKEMARLRSVSTRGRITPTSFVNEYEYGDFKGDEDAWMDQYFDAFLYFANWGTRVLKLRLSSRLLDKATADRYCVGESASAREHEGNTILTFNSDEEEEEWPEEEDALSALIPIRTQLAQGDLRGLYIGWLRSAQGELDDEETEPPVPPGLGELDGSLTRLVDFLRVDPDLVEAAAAASPPLAARKLTPKAIRAWIANRPVTEKDDYLERFIAGKEPALGAELQRLIGDRNVAAPASEPRTVGELLRAAEDATEIRRQAAAEQAQIEKKRHEEEKALARSKHLEFIARREPAVWREIDTLIATKQPVSYDRVISLLVDLRDIAVKTGDESRFLRGLEHLQMEHARKPALLLRMKQAGLPDRPQGPLLI